MGACYCKAPVIDEVLVDTSDIGERSPTSSESCEDGWPANAKRFGRKHKVARSGRPSSDGLVDQYPHFFSAQEEDSSHGSAMGEVVRHHQQRPASGASDGATLTGIADCVGPIFAHIAGFAASTPKEYVSICKQLSPACANASGDSVVDYWAQMYQSRWPAFYASQSDKGVKNWSEAYKHTKAGSVDCVLEIFDREKKRGFAMSAMPARVSVDVERNGFIARYISASVVPPEFIPACEEHRLRYCPSSVRRRLRPDLPTPAEPQNPEVSVSENYPHRLLTDLDEFEIGQPVELQWKMQYGSPFAWWYGHLEAIRYDQGSSTATATITFPHFPSECRWYRLRVTFGDGQMRACEFGGYTGGLRATNEAENKQWMFFFPQEPVVF